MGQKWEIVKSPKRSFQCITFFQLKIQFLNVILQPRLKASRMGCMSRSVGLLEMTPRVLTSWPIDMKKKCEFTESAPDIQ